MEHDFWHRRWQENEIGFHESDVNPALKEHFTELNLKKGDAIFVPLCGKSRDVGWLLDRGLTVTGAELSDVAVKQLFDDLALTPDIRQVGKLQRYSTGNLTIFQGDIFDLSHDVLGHIDAVYDRAALVALPEQMRQRYAAHLLTLTGCAKQLLICLEYDQARMDGPPFSVMANDVRDYYQAFYTVKHLARTEVQGGIKGLCPGFSVAWLLSPP